MGRARARGSRSGSGETSPSTPAFAALLLLLTLVAYAPTFSNGFIWDDDEHIVENTTLRSPGGLLRIWVEPGATMQYYPLTFSVWWAGYHLWGLHPLGYHLVSVLLHALTAVLFWRLLVQLEVPGALLAAFLFALHPVHVMSVAWATELKNTLSMSLALGACWAFLSSAGIRSRRSWRLYGLSLALFALAMLAKTAVGLLPAILLPILWWKKERVTARDVATVLPFASLAIGMGRLTAYVEHLTGAVGAEYELSLLQRLVISGKSFWFYLGKLLVPFHLTFIYPRWKIGAPTALALLPMVAVVALFAALGLLRRRLGRGPLVAMLHFYLGTSALILLLVLYMTRYSFVSDHWQYLGSLGPIALFAAGWTELERRAGRRFSVATRSLAATLLALLGFLTWKQCHLYRDQETLWRETLRLNPDAWIAHVNLGTIVAARGATSEALAEYVEALACDPFGSDPRVERGVELVRRGEPDAGIAQVRLAVTDHPFGHEALDGIGVAMAMGKRFEEAVDFFQGSVRTDARCVSARFNLGMALRRLGKLPDAVAALREAIRLDPGRKDAHRELAIALHLAGADAEAAREIREFERLGGKPSSELLRELKLARAEPTRLTSPAPAAIDAANPLVAATLRYRDAKKRDDLDDQRALLAPGARMRFGTPDDPGSEIVVGRGGGDPWAEWDRFFRSASTVQAADVKERTVRLTVSEINDWYRLVERPPSRYFMSYDFTEDGRIRGVLVHSIPDEPKAGDRLAEFKAWAATSRPGLVEKLMPAGKLDPALDKAKLWKASLLAWRKAVGLPMPREVEP